MTLKLDTAAYRDAYGRNPAGRRSPWTFDLLDGSSGRPVSAGRIEVGGPYRQALRSVRWRAVALGIGRGTIRVMP